MRKNQKTQMEGGASSMTHGYGMMMGMMDMAMMPMPTICCAPASKFFQK
jgi:hypothetical protein